MCSVNIRLNKQYPLLFAVVMDEITMNVRKDGVKELLYANDLVLLGDS